MFISKYAWISIDIYRYLYISMISKCSNSQMHIYSSISPCVQNCQSSTIALDERLQLGTYRVETRTSGIRRDHIYRSSMKY
jgi:hypothetical protein